MAHLNSDSQVHGGALISGILITTLFFFCGLASAQQLSTSNKKAVNLYQKGHKLSKERDFQGAISLFSKALEKDQFPEAYLRKASLFNAMGMLDSTYSNFQSYYKLSKTPLPSVLERMVAMSFERGSYQASLEYLTKLDESEAELKDPLEVELIRRSLKFSLNEVLKPDTLDIVPLPLTVNKYSLQYLPTITIDNSTLVYTKRDQLSGDEDIVESIFKDGKWSEARSVPGQVNTPLNEGASTISADGKVMIFTSCDRRGSLGSCDLYISRKGPNGWSKPKNMQAPINSYYWESQPSLSADGKTIYFSSNRPGGSGGRDLWVATYVDGAWTKPKNLGAPINTFKDETTPFIHSNGETLYFSSDGHVGLGGYDLIKGEKKDSLWTVKNLGYPINTHNDEIGLLIAGDGKTAYFAKEIQKDQQIVDSRIVSFELPQPMRASAASYVTGRIIDAITLKPVAAEIEVVDLASNAVLSLVSSTENDGNYTTVLPTDKELVFFAKKNGYLFHEANFSSKANSQLEPDTLDILLTPIREGVSLVLKNIYFDLNSYELREKSITELERVAEVLNENPQIVVEISGHTDNQGNANYNQNLSEDRASAVYSRLLELGISEKCMTYKGYGAKNPVASNDSEFGRQSNRRIEFRVLRVRS